MNQPSPVVHPRGLPGGGGLGDLVRLRGGLRLGRLHRGDVRPRGRRYLHQGRGWEMDMVCYLFISFFFLFNDPLKNRGLDGLLCFIILFNQSCSTHSNRGLDGLLCVFCFLVFPTHENRGRCMWGLCLDLAGGEWLSWFNGRVCFVQGSPFQGQGVEHTQVGLVEHHTCSRKLSNCPQSYGKQILPEKLSSISRRYTRFVGGQLMSVKCLLINPSNSINSW